MRRWNSDMTVLRERLDDVAARPTLLIWGDRDRAVGVTSGQRLAEMLGARLMVLKGVGHIAFAEMPQVCNAAMGEWLRA